MSSKIVLPSILILSCVNLCFAIPTGISEDVEIIRLCNASSPVSLDTVNTVLVHRDMQHPEARTKAFKCFLLCIYVEYEWMDRDGGFELHTIKSHLLAAQLPEHRVKSLLYTCTSTESSDPCDRASIFTECFWSLKTNDLEDEAAKMYMK